MNAVPSEMSTVRVGFSSRGCAPATRSVFSLEPRLVLLRTHIVGVSCSIDGIDGAVDERQTDGRGSVHLDGRRLCLWKWRWRREEVRA